MVSGRDSLDSIIAMCAELQNKSDEELDDFASELHEADSILDDIVNTADDQPHVGGGPKPKTKTPDIFDVPSTGERL